MIVLFWIMHVLLCVAVYILYRTDRIKTREAIFPTVVFVPVFGVILLLWEERVMRKGRMGEKEVGVDKLKIEDAKYRRIEVDKGENQDITVPLEEAILVNDTKVRRKLMLDILHKNPDEYIDLLQRTRLGTDAELTHYATTTMMEIQSKYEQKLQRYSTQLQRDSDNKTILVKYARELERYIKSGLITGNILMIYRNQWDFILEKLILEEPENKAYRLKKIHNQIEAANHERIEEQLKYIKDNWPEEEAVYRLYVNYYRSISRGDLVKELIYDIYKEGIYLSHEGKKWLEFWEQKELNT